MKVNHEHVIPGVSLLKVALLDFGLVFGVGFVLGPIRILWLVPRVGVRHTGRKLAKALIHYK